MGFEWDTRNWRENLDEHGVDFADAALIFLHPVLEAEANPAMTSVTPVHH
jgi:uncharacterized DUF497 family protein